MRKCTAFAEKASCSWEFNGLDCTLAGLKICLKRSSKNVFEVASKYVLKMQIVEENRFD